MKRISVEEMETCVATKEELDAYLKEPDDATAASLTLEQKTLVAKCILYGDKIADKQLQADQKEMRELFLELIEPCFEHSSGGIFTKRECPLCILALKKKYLKESKDD